MSAPAAFRKQLLDAIPRLRRYARSLVYDTHAADDLVQTALERALAHWHQFDQRRDLLAWLLSITHNAHLDEVRKQSRYAPLDEDNLRERQAGPAVDLDAGLDLLRALQRLPLEQREVLVLAGVEQLSYAECADILRIPVGTVMSRLSRGRAALRTLLSHPAGAATPSPAAARPTLRRIA
jgi:RNA polymerase sigma-70 factor (ECF subfamily)